MSAFVINSYAFGGEDPDAKAYLDAVESADTQALEAAVRKAVDDFVKGLKSDGIWSAIKASCILAGARTLAGALVPLVGSAPTNVSNLFVSGDYDREDGLIGVPANATRLDSNYNINSVPQDDWHFCVYVTTGPSMNATRGFCGATNDQLITSNATNLVLTTRCRSSAAFNTSNQATTTGLKGASRDNSATYVRRSGQNNTTITNTSSAPSSENMLIFTRASNYTDARMSFYSLGEALDLAALETRVATLMTDLDAAI